jgi:site-specific DNA-methyltransferase (adenine-specific)
MKLIPDKSIDMILCDLPYGTTACKWDSIIPFDKMWESYTRIIKDKGAIVLTAMQPFTTTLISSNLKLFKYCWVWNKKLAGNFLTAKLKPMITHEDICVFSKGATANGSKRNMKYNPQMELRDKPRKYKIGKQSELYYRENTDPSIEYESNYKYPKSIIEIPNTNRKEKVHPTQKPVELFEYLIKTYTNEGNIVLDNCIGSGTTAIAAININRNYIGFELDNTYYELANKRIEEHLKNKVG